MVLLTIRGEPHPEPLGTSSRLGLPPCRIGIFFPEKDFHEKGVAARRVPRPQTPSSGLFRPADVFSDKIKRLLPPSRPLANASGMGLQFLKIRQTFMIRKIRPHQLHGLVMTLAAVIFSREKIPETRIGPVGKGLYARFRPLKGLVMVARFLVKLRNLKIVIGVGQVFFLYLHHGFDICRTPLPGIPSCV